MSVGYLTDRFGFQFIGMLNWTNAIQKKEWFYGDASKDTILAEIMMNIIQHFHLDNPEVVVCSSEVVVPVIKLSLSDLTRYANEVFLQDSRNTWVFDMQSDWCIECCRTGKVTFGRTQKIV